MADIQVLSGVVGTITWHHYVAAAINGYTVSRSRDGCAWSLTATVVLSNPYNIAQRPLTFVAKHQKGDWRFPVLTVALSPPSRPHELTATLGPPITTKVGSMKPSAGRTR